MSEPVEIGRRDPTRGLHLVGPIHSDSASEDQIECSRRYLELAFGHARLLNTLYQTEPFSSMSEGSPPLVSISDERYWLMVAFAHGVQHDAGGTLSVTAWDSVLRTLARMVWEIIKGLIGFRNKAIDHREFVRPDGAVLRHWATTAETLAREVLSAAIIGWYRGARSSDALYRIVRAAYDRRGVPLPKN